MESLRERFTYAMSDAPRRPICKASSCFGSSMGLKDSQFRFRKSIMLIVWDGRVATNRSHVKVTRMIGMIGSPE